MKTKFKETIEKCDSLEHRLNDLLKEKQSIERKYVRSVLLAASQGGCICQCSCSVGSPDRLSNNVLKACSARETKGWGEIWAWVWIPGGSRRGLC